LTVEQVQERPGFTYCNIHRDSFSFSPLAITRCVYECVHTQTQ